MTCKIEKNDHYGQQVKLESFLFFKTKCQNLLLLIIDCGSLKVGVIIDVIM